MITDNSFLLSDKFGNNRGKPLEADPKPSLDYLQELLRDKRNIQIALPGVFYHLERLVENEISKVRMELFHLDDEFELNDSDFPKSEGPSVSLQEKIFIPIHQNPTYNFVGRLLGPGGMTTKHMEKGLDCKIMIRGKGSMRDKKKEENNRGKPNWEHLNEELHVLVTVEDAESRVHLKLQRVVESIRRFIDKAVKTPDGEDEIKKKQLIELALVNGTYRDMSKKDSVQNISPSNEISAQACVSWESSMVASPNLVAPDQCIASQPTLSSSANFGQQRAYFYWWGCPYIHTGNSQWPSVS